MPSVRRPPAPRPPVTTPTTPRTPFPPAATTTPSAPVAPTTPTTPAVALTVTDAQHAAGTKRLLETYFAPSDDPIQQDLAGIREILEARRADPRTFATDAENPYKIHYAVYNLRNPEVIKALAEAHNSGVDVQILIESDQLDPAKTWNTADEELRAAGLSFSETHKGLTAEQKKELDFIGIQGAGLMHLKTRFFSRPNPDGGPPLEKVLTGSMNPGDEAAHNHETLHLITDPVLVERYKAKYQSVLDGTELANTWQDAAPVNVLFTPTTKGPQPADKILQLVDQEKEAIFMSVFSLRDFTGQQERESLVQKLKAAKERGVEIVVVTDRKQSDGVDATGARMMADDKTEDLLRAAGIPVYECINEAGPFNAMHNKSAVFGLTNMKVVTDAGNWTQAALGGRGRPARNDESLLFIDSKRLDGNHTGERYLSNFLQLLRKYEHQQVDGDPGAEALIAKLQQHPAWPKVKVDFDVLAETYFGQDVYITGNHPALGDWTRDGPGLKLSTDAVTYPTWRADTSLELPFGTMLEFKIVKRDTRTGALEWDGRPNQLLVVDPGDRQNRAAVDGQIRAAERFQR